MVHRALTQKPNHNSPPRSMVVNFLEFTIKEMVRTENSLAEENCSGWTKLIFDCDYATEVVQKHKTYTRINKISKEKGISFQTPLTKMRIHWDSGLRLYKTAQEAAYNMRKQGHTVEITKSTTMETDAVMEQLQKVQPWQ